MPLFPNVVSYVCASTVAGQEDCWLLTETLIQTVSLQLKVCLNVQCLALHSFTDLHPGKRHRLQQLSIVEDTFKHQTLKPHRFSFLLVHCPPARSASVHLFTQSITTQHNCWAWTSGNYVFHCCVIIPGCQWGHDYVIWSHRHSTVESR